MVENRSALVTLTYAPASDSWGFVGVVAIGDVEAYRTIRAHTAPQDAVSAAQRLLASVLGSLMAGQEWSEADKEFGHAPLRTELGLGLTRRPESSPEPQQRTRRTI